MEAGSRANADNKALQLVGSAEQRNRELHRSDAISRFPATGVSLRQMVQFGSNPSTGTLYRASQFLSEELPIRLAHRVQELKDLPDGLDGMPSIQRVRDWYAQSFEVGSHGVHADSDRMTHYYPGNHNPAQAYTFERTQRASYEARKKQRQELSPA